MGTRVTCSALAGLLFAARVSAFAQETNPVRAPADVITQPGDLLKETDGSEFRFSYVPSYDRLLNEHDSAWRRQSPPRSATPS